MKKTEMENENFEEDLKNRIKQIFEDCDDGRANEGWDLLREKYSEKKRRDGFFWWISSAAVLLFTALLIWFFQPETYKLKPAKSMVKLKKDTIKTQVKVGPSFKKSFFKTVTSDANDTKKAVLKTASNFTSKQKTIQHKKLIVVQKNHDRNQTYKYHNTVFTDAKLVSTDSINHPTQTSGLPGFDSLQLKKLQPIAQTQNPSLKQAAQKEPVKTVSVKKPLLKVSRFGLSIYAGPHLNFAKSSNTLLGFGAGVSADFVLNKKLKLETGLSLLKNKLSYQSSSNNNLYAFIPAYQSASNLQSTIINTATLNSLNASLLQLDVPLNLIYTISPAKNSISVLAGLSSSTFAKETYQYNYANTASNMQSSKSFQSFYLLKTLNIAAQLGFPIKKYNLQAEPFLKLPLGGLTTQQLKFSSAGINLKMNLQSFKSKHK